MRDQILSVIPFQEWKGREDTETERIDLSVIERKLKLYFRSKTEEIYRKWEGDKLYLTV
jgi:hypothetical protein